RGAARRCAEPRGAQGRSPADARSRRAGGIAGQGALRSRSHLFRHQDHHHRHRLQHRRADEAGFLEGPPEARGEGARDLAKPALFGRRLAVPRRHEGAAGIRARLFREAESQRRRRDQGERRRADCGGRRREALRHHRRLHAAARSAERRAGGIRLSRRGRQHDHRTGGDSQRHQECRGRQGLRLLRPVACGPGAGARGGLLSGRFQPRPAERLPQPQGREIAGLRRRQGAERRAIQQYGLRRPVRRLMRAALGARRRPLGDRFGEPLLIALLLALVLAVAALPMARLLLEGFLPGGSADLAVAKRVLSAPVTWRAAGNSLALSAGATLVALAIGAPAALLVALTDLRGKAALVFCFLLPMMIPAQIATIAWIALVGPGSALLKALDLAPPPGTGNPLYSSLSIMLVMGVEHSAVVFLTLRAGARSLPGDAIEAAEVAGASRAALFARIILPLLTPSLAAGCVLAFVSSLGNFGVPALLGIPAGIITLPTLIYQRLAGFGPAVLSDVAVLSLLTGAIAGSGLALQSWILSRRSVRPVRVGARPHPLALGGWRLPAELACWSLLAIILLLPLLALVATSLVRAYGLPLNSDTMTFAQYRTVFGFDATARAFRN